jgi:hypothetical protein
MSYTERLRAGCYICQRVQGPWLRLCHRQRLRSWRLWAFGEAPRRRDFLVLAVLFLYPALRSCTTLLGCRLLHCKLGIFPSLCKNILSLITKYHRCWSRIHAYVGDFANLGRSACIRWRGEVLSPHARVPTNQAQSEFARTFLQIEAWVTRLELL